MDAETRMTPAMREKLARACATALTGGSPSKPKLIDYAAVDAMLAVLAQYKMAVRDGEGMVVHELRGEPNDIWQHMILSLIHI